jgi:ABC-type bacteriocin/lantibiotic exporter with double-glycine peptidase domain
MQPKVEKKYTVESLSSEVVLNEAIQELRQRLIQSVWRSRKERTPWEVCVCALALTLEPDCDWRRLADSVPYGLRHYEVDEFLDSIANFGYLARQAYLTVDDIDDRLMPCLFVSDKGKRPYIIISRTHVYDCTDQKFLSELPDPAGEVWFFEEYSIARSPLSPQSRKTTGLTWFRAVLKRFTKSYWQILVIGLFLNLAALSAPLFIMTVYDRVISAHTPDVLTMLAVGVTFALVMEWFLRQGQAKILSGFASRLDNVVSNEIFNRLLSLAPGYIERASVPAQVARMKTFESVRDFFSGAVFLSLLEMPFSVIALIAIGVIAGPLCMVPMAVIVLYGVLFAAVWHKVKVSIRDAAKATSARQQFSLETFEKLDSIRTFGLTDIWRKKYEELSAREVSAHFKLQWLGNIGETLAHGLTIMASVAVVSFGVHLIWAGQMSAGALVATMILCWRVLTPFYSLCTMIPRLDQLRNSVRQVNELMNIEEEKALGEIPKRALNWHGDVIFNQVGLRYPGDVNPVFSGLTFNVKPGELALVTGDNGSGKTSLLKMIMGMYLPQAGSIQIDGHDIRQLDPRELRHHISYISQYPHFFDGTIESNLRLASPLASAKEMEMALKQANIWDEIKHMPRGLQSRIGGEDSTYISTSMAFRLCMARAYLHKAPILLIDELPNSLMNDQAGKDLIDGILRLKKGRTVFMVTYRNDMMDAADHVIVLRRRRPPIVGPARLVTQKLKELS